MNKLYPDESLSFDTSSQDHDGVWQNKNRQLPTMCYLYERQGPRWHPEVPFETRRNEKTWLDKQIKVFLGAGDQPCIFWVGIDEELLMDLQFKLFLKKTMTLSEALAWVHLKKLSRR